MRVASSQAFLWSSFTEEEGRRDGTRDQSKCGGRLINNLGIYQNENKGCVCSYGCECMYIYMHTYTCVCVYIFIYVLYTQMCVYGGLCVYTGHVGCALCAIWALCASIYKHNKEAGFPCRLSRLQSMEARWCNDTIYGNCCIICYFLLPVPRVVLATPLIATAVCDLKRPSAQ